MNIPPVAQKLIQNIRAGSLGPGSVRSQADAERAKEIDSLCDSITYTAEADNEEGLDTNPKIGELKIENSEGSTDIVVQGNAAQGSMTEVTSRTDKTTWVYFLEADSKQSRGLEVLLDANGQLTTANAFVVDRQNLENSYEESSTARGFLIRK